MNMNNLKKVAGATALMAAAMIAPEVMAGSGTVTGVTTGATAGAEFNSVWETLTGWMTGTLGKVAAGSMILVGIIAGVVKQSLMSFAVGAGGGVGLYQTPTVIDAMFGSTLDKLPAATEAVQFTNGLL